MSIYDAVDKILKHHGVKGQKWGVRRSAKALARASIGRSSSGDKPSDKLTTPKRFQRGRAEKSTGAKRLSDEEMQKLVNRMRLEQDFKRLMAESQPKPKAEGFIKGLLKENAKRQVSRIARSAADIAIERALEKASVTKGKHATSSEGKKFAGEVSKALATARKKK